MTELSVRYMGTFARPSQGANVTRIVKDSDYLPNEYCFEVKIRGLSEAHLQILALTARGYLNKQIAWARGSSEQTVKSQQQEILRRLGLRSRTQAAVQFAVYCERNRTI